MMFAHARGDAATLSMHGLMSWPLSVTLVVSWRSMMTFTWTAPGRFARRAVHSRLVAGLRKVLAGSS
jgi:hypothetical protein